MSKTNAPDGPSPRSATKTKRTPPSPSPTTTSLDCIKGMIAPTSKTIPELLEDSVTNHHYFKAQIEQGQLEFEISYDPPRPGGKQELKFKFRS